MGRMLKNPRHERFVKEYLRLETATEAYRRSYPTSKGYNCASVGANRLLKKRRIRQRIREMRMEIKRKADITFEKVLTDYQEALELARAKGEAGNIIAAAREQAKLVGLLIDRKEVGAAGDFENMENVSDILEAVEKLAGPEAALALGQAFQVLPSPPSGGTVTVIKAAPDSEESEALAVVKAASDAVN